MAWLHLIKQVQRACVAILIEPVNKRCGSDLFRLPSPSSFQPPFIRLVMYSWHVNSLSSYRTLGGSDHSTALRYGNSATYSDIVEATNATVKVFEARGTKICAVGGLACKLLGNNRTPNVCVEALIVTSANHPTCHLMTQDVDLLLLDTTSSQEEIKRVLVNANSQFYLIPARNPQNTYKVLWYRTNMGVRVKVDLLQPGIMSIPSISPNEVEYKGVYGGTHNQIPIAPFGLVLLLKLQAWAQHRDSTEFRFRQKQYTDVADIDVLLPRAVTSRVKFDSLPDIFLREARRRVTEYGRAYPDSRVHWKALGLKTSSRTEGTTSISRPQVSTSRPSRTGAPRVSRETDLVASFARMRVAHEYSGYAVERDRYAYDYD